MKLLKKYKTILLYGSISVAVTFVDIIVTYFLKSIVHLVIANTIGVITGGIIQYLSNVKFVFKVKNDSKNFLIYILTFVFGLIVANLIIYYADVIISNFLTNDKLVFLLSKGLSIVIPFFMLYFLRKGLYKRFNDYERK